jgi:hypothetical protein
MTLLKKSKVLLVLAACLFVGAVFTARHHDAPNPPPELEVVPSHIFAYVHNWAMDTPLGTFGYVEILPKSPSVYGPKTERCFIVGHTGFDTQMSPKTVATCTLLVGVLLAITLGCFALIALKGGVSDERTA